MTRSQGYPKELVITAAEIHTSLGRTLTWRDPRVCSWLPVAVKDRDGKWIGQITQAGDFIPNVTEREKRAQAFADLAALDSELM